MSPEALKTVTVVGGGAWGTALAQAACRAGRSVTLVVRDDGVREEIARHRTHRAALGEVALDPRLDVTKTFVPADVVILAVPAQATRTALATIDPALLERRPVVLTAKGLERGTLARQSEILHEVTPHATGLVLSGPSFAADVASGRPTAVTLAGGDLDTAGAVAEALRSEVLRLYTSPDAVGVELAGALKNVYALACGAVEGAGLGLSARSAVLARAYAEMSRIVAALGGEPATLTGLAGLGDLTLSCTSPQSRNYRTGIALGQGLSPERSGAGLAEGVLTAPVAAALAASAGTDAPLIMAVNAVLSGGQTIDDIVRGLMARPLKQED